MKELRYYQNLVSKARKATEKWRKEAKETCQAYTAEKRFNVLYSNTDLLLAALASNHPRPVIRVRFARQNMARPQARELARVAAEAAERAVIYNQEQAGLKSALEAAVRETLLTGRGILRVQYEPEIVQTAVSVPLLDGNGGTVGEVEEIQEHIGAQKVRLQSVPYDSFLCTDTRDWADVWWVAFRHLMDKTELQEKFGGRAEGVPLAYREEADPGDKSQVRELAEVWELWDKREKKVIFFVQDWRQVLSEEEDPYGLEGFFPVGRPLQFVRGRDLTPVPEYRLYRKTAQELTRVTKRIDELVENIRAKSFYSADYKDELSALKNADDNTDVPIRANLGMLAAQGGLAALVAEYPNTGKSQVLGVLEQRKQSAVAEIYEITGIADILRGASDPQETAEAQKIKGQFGSVRLKARQAAVQYFVRDALRLCAEMVCEHFTLENLRQITALDLPTLAEKEQAQTAGQMLPQPTWEEVLQVLRTDGLRNCTLEVESTATVFDETAADKTARMELFGAINQLLATALPFMQANPEFMDAVKANVLFVVDAFPQSRVLKEAYEEAFAAWEARLKAPQPPQGPTPDMVLAQAEQVKAQAEMLMAQARQAEAQVKAQEAGVKLDLERQKIQLNMAKDAADTDLQRQKLAVEAAGKKPFEPIAGERM